MRHVSIVAPKLAEIKQQQNLDLGAKFKFLCYVERGTKPLEFKWAIDHFSEKRHKIITTEDESILTIERLEAIDSGLYSCTVHNSQGTDHQRVQLAVKCRLFVRACIDSGASWAEVLPTFFAIHVWRTGRHFPTRKCLT